MTRNAPLGLDLGRSALPADPPGLGRNAAALAKIARSSATTNVFEKVGKNISKPTGAKLGNNFGFIVSLSYVPID
ncbi:hypothetical protein AcW1_009339 [Taiwanofungus camphoratus]|nr:hypothetical protein AcW1_009339 [Antrodia cinnamomea]